MAQALPFIAAAASAASTFSQGRQQQAVADYNTSIARQNAQIAEQQTKAELDVADRQRRLRLGANIAAGGASGVGQPFDILSDNVAQETLNLLTLESEGLLKKRSFEQQAALSKLQRPSTAGLIMSSVSSGLKGYAGAGGSFGGGSGFATPSSTKLSANSYSLASKGSLY